MKAVIIGLFLAGFAILLFGGFLFTRCLYSPQAGLHFSDFLIMAVGASMSLVALFLRSRLKAGGPILELTERDRKEIRDLRTELNPRNLLARLLIVFGGLFVLTGCCALFRNITAGPKTLMVALLVLGLGAVCLFSGITLSKKR